MTVELTMLLYSVVLTFVLISFHATVAILHFGAVPLAGSRDNLDEPSVFVARALRLSKNMQENMVLFVPLVLAAHAAGISNDTTVMGAQLFVAARVVHAVIYLAGWPYIRPVAYFTGVYGCAMIAFAMM